jgi:cathepsin L
MNTKNRIGLAVVVATVVASFLPLGCAHGQHDLGQASLTFGDFLQAYGKEYSAAEYATRKTLYEKRRAAVVQQNKLYHAGSSGWWAAINVYSDYTEEEQLKLRMRNYRPEPITTSTQVFRAPPRASNPKEKSWMDVQSPVKNQGSCGSCWTFASTECVESHLAIAEGGNSSKMEILAPQTLVNCVKNPNQCGGTGGCEGATEEIAFNYTRDHGLALERDLPYHAKDEPCTKYPSAVTSDGYVKVKRNSAVDLETALATVGPVAITVAAGNWFNYGGGVYSGGCKMPVIWKTDVCNLDHAVLAVGYTQDYWVVRNSWGPGWGEKGYIKLTRKNDDKKFRDDDPSSGVDCKPYPKHDYPAGESGCLYDSSYPVGVRRSS